MVSFTSTIVSIILSPDTTNPNIGDSNEPSIDSKSNKFPYLESEQVILYVIYSSPSITFLIVLFFSFSDTPSPQNSENEITLGSLLSEFNRPLSPSSPIVNVYVVAPALDSLYSFIAALLKFTSQYIPSFPFTTNFVSVDLLSSFVKPSGSDILKEFNKEYKKMYGRYYNHPKEFKENKFKEWSKKLLN